MWTKKAPDIQTSQARCCGKRDLHGSNSAPVRHARVPAKVKQTRMITSVPPWKAARVITPSPSCSCTDKCTVVCLNFSYVDSFKLVGTNFTYMFTFLSHLLCRTRWRCWLPLGSLLCPHHCLDDKPSLQPASLYFVGASNVEPYACVAYQNTGRALPHFDPISLSSSRWGAQEMN